VPPSTTKFPVRVNPPPGAKLTPDGIVTVSPEEPSVNVVPDWGNIVSTSTLLIIRLPMFLL